MPQSWEYLFVRAKSGLKPSDKIREVSVGGYNETAASFDELFNRLGTDGWEMVNVSSTVDPQYDTIYYCAAFKRPKE